MTMPRTTNNKMYHIAHAAMLDWQDRHSGINPTYRDLMKLWMLACTSAVEYRIHKMIARGEVIKRGNQPHAVRLPESEDTNG